MTGSFFKNGASFARMVPIGHDDAEDKSYVLFVSLDPMVGEDALELMFRIVEYDRETDAEHIFWSGKDVARFIRQDDRTTIRFALCGAVRHLLTDANPAKVFMCTMDTYAPEVANRKFMLLAHVFEICGYSVQTADPYHGQQVWWMERKSPDTIVGRPSGETL
jgi:hypothetical protein